MSANAIVLRLMSGELPSLFETEVRREGYGTPILCVRGKTAGAYRGAGTFQWTYAVQAITALLILHKIYGTAPFQHRSTLVGLRDSLASSLDYAISKRPQWLCEMFGTTSNGDAFASRLFRRSNPNRKRPGPVIVSVNEKLLASDGIEVMLDGKACDAATLEKLANALLEEPASHDALAA